VFRLKEIAQPLTAPTRYAEILQVANAFFNCALRAKYFSFAIQFSTFNQVLCGKTILCKKSAHLVAANRYMQPIH
jgi:hypothetical protein